jgi:hypothetical protein
VGFRNVSRVVALWARNHKRPRIHSNVFSWTSESRNEVVDGGVIVGHNFEPVGAIIGIEVQYFSAPMTVRIFFHKSIAAFSKISRVGHRVLLFLDLLRWKQPG